jgi:hypothetical protein
MMADAGTITSETSVNLNQTTRHYNPEVSHLHTQKPSWYFRCRGNLVSLTADSSSAGQFPRALLDPELYYSVQNRQPLGSKLSQMHPVHTVTLLTS